MTSVSWIPTPAGVTSLPPAPAVVDNTPSRWRGFVADVGADPQATLTAAAPTPLTGDGVQETSSWDIWKYDGSVWVNLGPDVGPTLTVTSLIPMFDQVLPAVASTRTRLVATSIPYALELLTELAVTTQTALAVTKIIKVDVPAADVSVGGVAPAVSIGVALRPPAVDVAVAGGVPAVSTTTLVQVPAADVAVGGEAPTVDASLTVVIVPVADITVAGATPDLQAGDDYYSNLASQFFTLLRDWRVDWWGD